MLTAMSNWEPALWKILVLSPACIINDSLLLTLLMDILSQLDREQTTLCLSDGGQVEFFPLLVSVAIILTSDMIPSILRDCLVIFVLLWS